MLEKDEKVKFIEYKELKKGNGDVFFEVKRMADNSYIEVNWIGIQSLETIVMGGNHILGMLRNKTCSALLNSNKELIGPWEIAVNWLVNKWAPQASGLGLLYYGHVLSPGIYGQRSYDLFQQKLKTGLVLKSFFDDESAANWLILKTM